MEKLTKEETREIIKKLEEDYGVYEYETEGIDEIEVYLSTASCSEYVVTLDLDDIVESAEREKEYFDIDEWIDENAPAIRESGWSYREIIKEAESIYDEIDELEYKIRKWAEEIKERAE